MTSLDLAAPSLDNVQARILAQRAVPVVRASSADDATRMCQQLILGGITVIELTTTIPDWQRALQNVLAEHDDAIIGMGTVTDAAAAAEATAAGAHFIVSPYPAPEARAVVRDAGRLFIGGGFTPGEIAESSNDGLCKLFPAHLGGPAYVKTLTAILPDALIMPTGGIRVGEVGSWLRAGAVAVGVGSDLYAAPDLDAAIAELRAQLDNA